MAATYICVELPIGNVLDSARITALVTGVGVVFGQPVKTCTDC